MEMRQAGPVVEPGMRDCNGRDMSKTRQNMPETDKACATVA